MPAKTAIVSPSPVARAKPVSLRRNFLWAMTGNGSYAVCQWGMVIALARLGTPELVGQFALGLTIAAPIMLLANLQLRQAQSTDVANQFPFAVYFTVRILTSLLALLIIAAYAWLSESPFETGAVIVAVGMSKAFESVSDVYHGLFQKHERMDLIAWSLMLKGPFSLAALALGVYVSGRVLPGTIAMTAVWALVLFFYDIPIAKRLLTATEGGATAAPPWRLAVAGGPLGRVIRQTLPLGAGMFLISLHTNIPRFFLERQFGVAELGVFAAIAFFMQIGFLVEVALTQAAMPRLSQLFAARQYAGFRHLLGKLLAISAVIGVGGLAVSLVAGRPLLAWIYGLEYARHTATFAWLMLAAAFGYAIGFLRAAITATRRFDIQLPLFALLALSSAIGAYLLIPRWGLVGAALAVVVARALLLVACAFVLRIILRRESTV